METMKKMKQKLTDTETTEPHVNRMLVNYDDLSVANMEIRKSTINASLTIEPRNLEKAPTDREQSNISDIWNMKDFLGISRFCISKSCLLLKHMKNGIFYIKTIFVQKKSVLK